MRVQGKLLRMDAKRCFLSWRFIGIIVAVCIICLLSMLEVLGVVLTKGRSYGYSSADQLNGMLLFERFKPLLIVALAAVYSCSFVEDWKHRYFRFIHVRSNLRAYAVSKIIITVTGVVLAATLGFLLFGLVLYPWMPMGIIADTPELELSLVSYSDYTDILTGPFPALYFILQGWTFGLAASFPALAGLWLTTYQSNAFLGIGGPFFIFYAMIAISYWLLPDYLNYLYIGIFYHLSILPKNIWIELGYHTAYLVVLNVITGFGFYCSLRKRWKNGLL